MKAGRHPNGPPWHVVHVIGSLRTGGAEKMLVNLMQAVDRREFRHSVLCLDSVGDLAPTIEAMGIPVRVHAVRLRNLPRDVRALAGWFLAEGVSVIHSHMFYASFWSQLAGLRAGVPVFVTTEHGKELWKNRLQIAVGRWLSARTFRHIAVSEDVREIRRSRHGIPDARLVVIPNGVPVPPAGRDTEARARVRGEFGLASGQPVLGTVGRVVEAKAYPVLAEALALAKQTMPDLHWLQIGDGPDLPDLVAQVEARGLSESVTLAGRRSDVGDLLAGLDLWVMSSVREGLPVALLEAMGAECPVVATDVGGIPDAVTHGESAWLVPPGDADALAAGIRHVLADPALAARLAAAARARVVQDYGIEAVARRIEDIYREGLVRVSAAEP